MDKANIDSGGVQIATQHYKPSGKPNGAAIVLAYGSDGLVNNKNGLWASMIGEDAADLAAQGFHALVPDYFLRTKTPADSIDYYHGGLDVVLANKLAWEQTLADVLKHAQTLVPGGTRIGLLGYSLGAYLSLRLRAQAKAVVAFFPPLLDGVGTLPTPGLPVLMAYGTADRLYKSDSGPIAKQLRDAKAALTSKEYKDANHGFSGTDAANTTARAQSKAHTVSFFVSTL